MSRIRVAHVITRLCTGGAQENTFHTVRLADPNRFDVSLYAGPTDGAEGSIEGEVAAAGIAVERIPDLCRAPHPLRDWTALRALTAHFRAGRYDIVHTHTSKAGYLGRLAARRAGVPVIIHTPHGHIFDGYFPRPVTAFYSALERHAAGFTSRIITLTEAEVVQHLAHGIGRPAQFLPIFSGIDLNLFREGRSYREATRAEWGAGADDFVIIGVGRLEPIKGFRYLMQAAARVASRMPHARFVVIGDGAERYALEAAAAPLGNRVRFLGIRRDVPRLLAAADLLVLPSVNEGMGRVLLEAGAAQVPVVASAVGGVPELLAGGKHGLLVPPRDGDAIAGAIEHLAAAPAARQALAASWGNTVMSSYSVESMVQRIEALYEECLLETRS